MINNTQASKKYYSKYKPNLIQKYIACKSIKDRSRPSLLNLQQRMFFTQSTPSQDKLYLKFKQNLCESPFGWKPRQNHAQPRQPQIILAKEDLRKLGKANQDQNDRKVTKISLLLKKLVNQQQQCDKKKMQQACEPIVQNRSLNDIRNRSRQEKNYQKQSSLKAKSNINLKHVECGLVGLKKEKKHDHAYHKMQTSRNSHMRYASAASKLKMKYKLLESNCLQTLKIHRCTKSKISWQLDPKEERAFNQKSYCQQKSLSRQLRLQSKDRRIHRRKSSDRQLPLLSSLMDSEAHDLTIQPWTQHQIMVNDPISL